MDLIYYRPKIREALWLWLVLNNYAQPAPPETQWRVILNTAGTVAKISDVEVAAYLGTPESTARRWRLRLESVGLIRSTPADGMRVRQIEVLNLEYRPAGEVRAPPQPKAFLN